MKLGVVAAKRQTAMVMHVDYQVRLPSHDYAVASKHYFIPSVYSFLTILPSSIGQKNAVTYSGPTGVFIRSGKHDQTNACTHRVDLTTLILSPKFKEYTHNSRGFKKVLVLRSDNSTDEAPRNPSTQKKMIQLFIKFDLVMLVLASLPAGYALFNPCERRMAPLSKVLTGVLLDHKHYGSHLNSQKQTVDGVLEIRNFKYAGDRLPSCLVIWYTTNTKLTHAMWILLQYAEFRNYQLPACLSMLTPSGYNRTLFAANIYYKI